MLFFRASASPRFLLGDVDHPTAASGDPNDAPWRQSGPPNCSGP